MTRRASSDLHEAQARLHRALGDPSRLRILELLQEADAPLDASELAEQVGLHVNTVRTHLGRLAEAGLVSSGRARGSQPGRPRVVYEAKPEGVGQGTRGYRLLAEIFAGCLASSAADPTSELEQAGRAWGRFLVERPAPLRPVTSKEAVEEVLRVNAELGFEPELCEHEGQTEIVMRRCPFVELAEEYGDVVCPVHLGLMQGAVAELSAGIEVTCLKPFVEPGLCIAELAAVK